jgi:hypothetical protein
VRNAVCWDPSEKSNPVPGSVARPYACGTAENSAYLHTAQQGQTQEAVHVASPHDPRGGTTHTGDFWTNQAV